MNDAFNFLNKINKRISAIINFGGTVSNPLLPAYTQSLRELNIKYKWDKDEQTIKINLGKENQTKAAALEKKLEENHATTFREYKKNFKTRMEQEYGRPLTKEDLEYELRAQLSLWTLRDNFEVFYSYTRQGRPLPPELKPYESIIKEFQGKENNAQLRSDPERLKDLALELEQAVTKYRRDERARAMNDVRRGRAL